MRRQEHICLALIISLAPLMVGCANRAGWGFWWGQGTIERQKARAAIHDPYPLNDIGPEVVGGRPREFASPQPEPVRQHVLENQFPSTFQFPP
ncbi:MAG: hypothetical protein KatS3mg111_1743 [Pirellulaceae bacterium]|nr:MAG: hypothetical protein KatS3mg111_1743 [Pirellulaceae bacterium]